MVRWRHIYGRIVAGSLFFWYYVAVSCSLFVCGLGACVNESKEMPAMRRTHSVVCLLLVVSCVLVCGVPVRASHQNRLTASLPNGFVVGACTHFSQGKGILDRNLDRIKQAGIASIRDEVGWGAVEREKGKLVMPEQFDTYVRRTAARA